MQRGIHNSRQEILMGSHIEAFVGSLVLQFRKLDADFARVTRARSGADDKVRTLALLDLAEWKLIVALAKETHYCPLAFVSLKLVDTFRLWH